MNKPLTGREKDIFDQEITRNWLLDYYYTFENVPLHFSYWDRIDKGTLSEIELRNKAVVEGIWEDVYNIFCAYNIGYLPLYRQHALMLPLQAFHYGSGQPLPIMEEPESSGRVYRSAELFRSQWEEWMEKEGPALVEQLKAMRITGEWGILLGAPDRCMRLVSVMPFGNHVVAECTVRWTDNGLIKETAFGVVLLFDIDGTVLFDRSYCDLINWPSSPDMNTRTKAFQEGAAFKGQTKGLLDIYYNRYNGRKMAPELSPLERRNREIVEERWLNACNAVDDKIFHPQRFRRQLPLQGLSYKLATACEVERIIADQAPDRKIRIMQTYARGNQVVVECIMSWTEANIYRESPFLSLLLLDADGLVIRDRSYITLDYWPAVRKISQRLRIPEPQH